MSNAVKLTVLIPEDLRTEAKVAAARHGHSLSAIVREALAEYVERMEDAELGPEGQAAYERWLADPSSAQPWEEVKAELRAEGLLDD
jgi:plasmid stability protein